MNNSFLGSPVDVGGAWEGGWGIAHFENESGNESWRSNAYGIASHLQECYETKGAVSD